MSTAQLPVVTPGMDRELAKSIREANKGAAAMAKMMVRKQQKQAEKPVIAKPIAVIEDEDDDPFYTELMSKAPKENKRTPTCIDPLRYFDGSGRFSFQLYNKVFTHWCINKYSKDGGSRFDKMNEKWDCEKDMSMREMLIKKYNSMECNDPTFYVKEFGMVPIMMYRGDKKPLDKGWQNYQIGSYDKSEWNRCSADDLNVAVITGHRSNIFVIDIDIPKEGETHGLEWLELQYEVACLSGHDQIKYPGSDMYASHYLDTFVQESGSGGLHLFYEYEPICDIISSVARNVVVEDGKTYSIDIKNNGGNITMTPSLHKSGNKYRVLSEYNGVKTHCVPKFMPRWLVSSLIHLMQQNGASFKHIKSDSIASFENGKMITPEMKFQAKASKKFDATIINDTDTVYAYFKRINVKRWDNYSDWDTMIVLLSNLSRRAGDPNLYYKLACSLSATSNKWSEESLDALKKRWNIDDVEYPYGFKRLNEWLRHDIGTKEMYHEFLSEIGMFKRNTNYMWSDYSSMHDLDGQNKQDVNKVWDFMRDCIFPISGMSGGMVYLRKILSHDPLYDKEYVEYTASSTSQMKDILDNIKIRNAKEKLVGKEIVLQDKSLMEYVKDYQIKNNYTKVVCTPYSAKSDNKAAAINKAKYKTHNLFNGLCNKYDPDFVIDHEFLAPAFNHISDLCDNKEDLTTYMIKWFAHVVQFPNVKTDTIWMIKSEQGVGKTMLFDWFGQSVLGKNYYFKTSDIEKVVGKFNSSTAGKLMVVLEEVDTFEGDHRIMNRLKDLSTGRLQSIEYKNKDAIMVEDYCNYAILTNRDYSVRIEKGDRRYICYESPRKYPVIDPHWDFMAAFFADPKSSEHFYHYLMGVEVHKSELRKIPETALRNEMKARNCHELVEYVYGLYDQLFFDDEGVRNDRTHIEFSNADALEGWAQVLRSHGRPNTSVDSRQVGIKMKSNFGDSYAGNGYVSVRKMLNGVRDTIYTLSYDNIVRVLKDNGFNL